MSAWLQLLVWTVAAVGPNGYEISRQLAAADALERRLLPLTELSRAAPGSYIVFHQRPDLSRAFYLPAGGVDNPPAAENAWMLLGCERPLASLRVPRLFLSANTYRRPEGLMPLREMAVDVAEHYFRAVLAMRFEQRWPERSTATEPLRQRAAALMVDVPADHQLEAYRSALLDFAAHLMTMANEIGRHQRRRNGVPEKSLCPLLAREAAIFGLWRRSVEDAPYPGQYLSTVATGAAVEAKISRAVLASTDKRWVIETLLGGAWTGDPKRDFAALCN